MDNTSNPIVCVVGQGYVGLPLAKAAVDAGYRVIGFDTDRNKIDTLIRMKSPIEDVTDEDLRAMWHTNYTVEYNASQIRNAHGDAPDIWVVTVPTPLKDGQPDLHAVQSAARIISPYIKPDALVILESTVAPGTTEGIFADMLSLSRASERDFHLAFSPERIDPGNQKFSFTNTKKLVAGVDKESLNRACDFYGDILDVGMVVPVSGIKVAETAKLLDNTFRHVNIALVNELAKHCDSLGINVWDVVNAAATKPYGFMPFYPGPGVGGHCLPVDPAYLGSAVHALTGQPFHFVNLAMEINAAQPSYVVHRVIRALNDDQVAVKGSKILLMGYAYKPDTADMRESPAQEIYVELDALGAKVDVYDPLVPMRDFLGVFPATRLDTYDIVILVTAHSIFNNLYGIIADSGALVLDTRNVFPAADNVIKL